MPIDNTINNAYIWYSGATDVTGKKLAEALGIKHGNKKPAAKDVCMVIGWGAKTKERVSGLSKIPFMNHPDSIRVNRNKLEALKLMRDAKVSVAGFIEASEVSNIGKKKCPVTLPCIGRTKYHQGGKGFWDCPTMTHVNSAMQEGAQYFQNLIEITEEYRLHVFDDNVIYAVKKVKRTPEETAEAYVRQELEKQKNIAAKKGNSFDEAMVKSVLENQAKLFAQNGANMLIRSNRAGWKFARVKSVSKDLEKEAIKALKAIGLTFGAVDCCVAADKKPYIIEVNTGPGLEESTFNKWVEAFTNSINAVLGGDTKSSNPAAPKTAGSTTVVGNGKESLKHRIRLMQDMVEAADDEEAAVLGSVFKKMFG